LVSGLATGFKSGLESGFESSLEASWVSGLETGLSSGFETGFELLAGSSGFFFFCSTLMLTISSFGGSG
jgi:hypothetical protein